MLCVILMVMLCCSTRKSILVLQGLLATTFYTFACSLRLQTDTCTLHVFFATLAVYAFCSARLAVRRGPAMSWLFHIVNQCTVLIIQSMCVEDSFNQCEQSGQNNNCLGCFFLFFFVPLHKTGKHFFFSVIK